MRIGFDAKRAFYNNTGLGNYGRGVIECLNEFKPNIEKHFFAPNQKLLVDERLLEMGHTHYMRGPLKNVNRVLNLTKSIKKYDLDIYHGLTNEIPLKINRIDLKTVVTIHDVIFLKFPKYYKTIDRKIYYYKTLYATQNADLIITTSNQTKQDLDEFFGCGDKCQTIYQHANLADIEPAIIDEPQPYFLYVSSFEKRKNHLNLIEAFNLVKNEIPENLILIGRKKETWELIKEKVKELGLTKRIKILTDVGNEQIQGYLKQAKGFIYPSLYEGFGIPLIEAMFANIPIACSKIPVFEELAQDAAIYFDSKSILDIKNALKQLNNPHLVKEKIEIAQDLKSFFTATAHANELSKVYKHLLS